MRLSCLDTLVSLTRVLLVTDRNIASFGAQPRNDFEDASPVCVNDTLLTTNKRLPTSRVKNRSSSVKNDVRFSANPCELREDDVFVSA